MAIQYHCGSCNKPIEVDDEAAGQMVSCPFCQNMSVAPSSSDPTIRIDNAPLAPPGSVPPVAVGSPANTAGDWPGLKPASARPPSNRNPIVDKLGWIALACMGLAVMCFLLQNMAMAPAMPDLQSEEPPDMQEMMELGAKTVADKPWLMLLSMLALLLPIVAMILSVVSLALKGVPKWPAIATLCTGGCFMAFMCLSLF